ncbi:MAG: hypothetical protein JXB10_12590 [Pirellulales bacterium]|nr:hypothetical protein [Pirellulales bacterium]
MPKELPTRDRPASYHGCPVDVTLTGGVLRGGVTLQKLVEGKAQGTYSAAAVSNGPSGRPEVLGARRIREIALPGARPFLVYQAKSNALTIAPDAGAAKGKNKLPGAKSSVRWPELSERQQYAAVLEEKNLLQEIDREVPNAGMKLYETRRFIFYSDIPERWIATLYAPYLDQMYGKLCQAYGLDPQQNLWRGKAVILAYQNPASFTIFETKLFHFERPSAQGAAHCLSDGTVLIACYAGRDPHYFGAVLVHETAHGFTHRFCSPRRIPSWLNEGISEWIAKQVVPQDQGINRKVQRAVQRMRESGSLGGDFFTAEHIGDWQYGAAASMVDFLLRSPGASRRGKSAVPFHQFVELIKDGVPWEESLQRAYGMTPAELTWNFGKSLGIPNLRP